MDLPTDDHTAPASTNGDAPARLTAVRDRSLLAGWSVTRVFYLALALTSGMAAADALLGRRVILVGALIVGPCCGLLTGVASRTAVVGVWAIVLAAILGVADSNFGSWTHLAYLSSVAIVTVVTIAAAALIERVRQQHR